MRVPRSPRALYLLPGIALVALALWGFWPRARPMEVARITRGPLTIGFTEEGRTRLRELYVVSAPTDGTVERIALEPGDRVRAGDPVAVLRPANAALFDPSARAEAEARQRIAGDALAAAAADATAAEAARVRMEAAQRRAETLAGRQLIARDQLDEIRARSAAAAAAVRSARARVSAARIQRDAARAVLALQGSAASSGPRLLLRAPAGGRVIRRYLESEAPVRAGQPLLDIGEPGALEVVVEVLTQDATRLAHGMPVRLRNWGGEGPLHGTVATVEPGGFTKVSALGVEEQRVAVVVALPAGRPPAGLGDGFRVEAEFQTWHGDRVLSIPVPALFHDGDAWAAYVLEDGRARLRRIGIGRMSGTAAEITSGLEAGAEVVLYPDDTLRDGMRVAPAHPGVDPGHAKSDRMRRSNGGPVGPSRR